MPLKAFRLAVAACLYLFCSGTALAGFTGELHIIGLDVGDTGVLTIAFTQPVVCGQTRVHVPKSFSYYNDMLAMALSAHATGKPVRVWAESCAGIGIHGPPIYRMVQGSVW